MSQEQPDEEICKARCGGRMRSPWSLGAPPHNRQPWSSSNPSFWEFVVTAWHRHGWLSYCVCVLVPLSCSTLCDPMDCSPSTVDRSFSVHEVLQARIPEWIAMPSSRGSPQPTNRTQVTCLQHWQAGFLSLVPPGKPKQKVVLPKSVTSLSRQQAI